MATQPRVKQGGDRGSNQYGTYEAKVSQNPLPTLDEAGIDKNLAHRARKAAMRAYSPMARDSELIGLATELRMRAERRLGEMIAAQPKATGGEHGGKKTLDGLRNNPTNPTATLAEAGVDKNLAHRARKAAKLNDKEFEAKVMASKAKAAGEVKKPRAKRAGPPPRVSLVQRMAMAKDFLDNGMSRLDVAAKYGVSEASVRFAVFEERGRRETKVDVDNLPKSAKAKLDAAVRRNRLINGVFVTPLRISGFKTARRQTGTANGWLAARP
jgi:hypothetical protein